MLTQLSVIAFRQPKRLQFKHTTLPTMIPSHSKMEEKEHTCEPHKLLEGGQCIA